MIVIPTSVSAEKPKGAPFFVQPCPFSCGKQVDFATIDIDQEKIHSWPMVYILSNDTHAYVGQTTKVISRMGQHSANEERRGFDTVTIISNDEFNASVITDYEHRLIGLMGADNRFILTNKNDGLTDSNYFCKDLYEKMFYELWDELRKRKLAIKSIPEIEESELFRYSPYKSLNEGQSEALDAILKAIESKEGSCEPIVVEGVPGTGKTVLAVYLLKMLKDKPEFQNKKIALVEPMPSLRKTLKKVLKTINGLQATDIVGPGDVAKAAPGTEPDKKAFDILLVDEAHRLKQYRNIVGRKAFKIASATLGLNYETCSEVDWIIRQAKIPVFFYDPLQSVKPSFLNEDRFVSSVGEAATHPIELTEQMRCAGGSEYLSYVRDIICGRNPEPISFETYDFFMHDTFDDFYECFEERLRESDLTRMTAGFAWKWTTKGRSGNPPEVYDIEIEGRRLKWNSSQEGWVDMGLTDTHVAREVGCIHTIQGYDLSHSFVIVGPDLKFDAKLQMPTVDRTSYFDTNGKNGTTDDELLGYIRNIYYVLMTRGIQSTHLYVCDESLRYYFRKFFLRGF